MSAGWPAQLAVSVFSRLDSYASSPGNGAYRYAELAISSLAVTETSAPIHGRMARLSWPGYIPKWYANPKTVTHPSTNRA